MHLHWKWSHIDLHGAPPGIIWWIANNLIRRHSEYTLGAGVAFEDKSICVLDDYSFLHRGNDRAVSFFTITESLFSPPSLGDVFDGAFIVENAAIVIADQNSVFAHVNDHAVRSHP